MGPELHIINFLYNINTVLNLFLTYCTLQFIAVELKFHFQVPVFFDQCHFKLITYVGYLRPISVISYSGNHFLNTQFRSNCLSLTVDRAEYDLRVVFKNQSRAHVQSMGSFKIYAYKIFDLFYHPYPTMVTISEEIVLVLGKKIYSSLTLALSKTHLFLILSF